jgi:hypothetical protein
MMKIIRKLAKPVAYSVILALTLFSVQMPAYGAIISTGTAIQEKDTAAARAHIQSMLARKDVQKQLISAGVRPDEVSARVNAMTDTEVAQLSGQLNKAAAGGDALGVALFVFLVLIFTDLMGWTHIFPFTKKGALRD